MLKARLAACVAALFAACAPAAVAATPTVTVGGPTAPPPTSTTQGFLGLATSTSTIPGLSGSATNPDVPFDNLVKGLSPGAPPLLRIGGNSADDSWWPTPGARPVDKEQYLYKLTAKWGERVGAMLKALGGKALLGVNLDLSDGVNAQVAGDEIENFNRYIGSGRVEAFELGNEPEFFPLSLVTGNRQSGHDTIAAYGRKFSAIAAQLGDVPLAGPGSVGPVWVGSLGQILEHLPARLKLATVHAYAMQNCSRLAHLSLPDFFDSASIEGLAATMRKAVQAAAAHGKPLRIDEMNGITCGGKAGMSNTFAEALWALNALPALWNAGVQGVNFQSVDGGYNQMISAHHSGRDWRISVEPVYYGLLAFAQVAPAGARLLSVSVPGLPDFFQFAVRAPDGSERVVLSNVGGTNRTVSVHAAGVHGDGSVSLLTAASLRATGGVTLGGRPLSAQTGQLAGAPRTTTVRPGAERTYSVKVPAHSAAILTLAG